MPTVPQVPRVLRVLMLGAALIYGTTVGAAIKATIDVDAHLPTPVPHRYIHGVIPDDAKFQLALPDNWNGKLVVFSRGFSGTELTPGAFKTVALEKGYAFAASDGRLESTHDCALPPPLTPEQLTVLSAIYVFQPRCGAGTRSTWAGGRRARTLDRPSREQREEGGAGS